MRERPSLSPALIDDHISQIPALQLLQNLGYVYLRREEAHLERGGKLSNALLEGVLEKQLRRLNRINFKGADHEFSDANIHAAIQALKDVVLTDGLIRANERIYDLLSLGKSFEQTIDGDTKSFTLNYVDWKRSENNVYHVTEEFEIERADRPGTCRADAVLFVNGIPFAVIECSRPNEKDAIRKAVAKLLRNQQYIPKLFAYSQILLAITHKEAIYGTTGTPHEFWARWREREDVSEEVGKLVNRALTKEQKDKLFAGSFAYARRYFDESEMEGREGAEQDRAIYCLLRPERLIELTRQFIVFDAGRKKIARYQQYFAVKKTMETIKRIGADGRRSGGVIWHTQGSGKSLTMVMMAKAIALEESVSDPRIVLVSDRIDLDDQIWATFHSCGKEPVKASTGRHLLELLSQRKAAVITTVIDKFEIAVKASNYKNDSCDIFALIDESHRSQYGETNARMQKVLPNACYIGFTGTPLKKKDKDTARKFGGVIDSYTIDEAVRDKAVVPILYEGRPISPAGGSMGMDRRILTIARDISEHFSKNIPKPFKAQLATESKMAAIKYKQYLDEIGAVTSEVLISAPEAREGDETIERAGHEEVQAFWRRMMERYGNEKEYNRSLIEAFNKSDEPKIIIVVDKLLTGFDSPRNAVLYLDKSLKEHSLLQAIARVNRLSEGKEFGFIVDYFGVLGALGKALDLYTTLSEFDREDLTLALTDISEEIAKLPKRRAELWGIFKGIEERKNEEALEQSLGAEDLRERFYENFSRFNRTMSVAFSSASFKSDTPGEILEGYKKDLVFFQKLRVKMKQRYAEEIDFHEHEEKLQKLIDSHTSSIGKLRIPPLVPIFDHEVFQVQVNMAESAASKAETIANRTRKAIEEKMEEDPSFYINSSMTLDKVVLDWREGRITDAESLDHVTKVMTRVRDRSGAGLPTELQNRDAALAFYGMLNDVFGKLKTLPPDADKIATETALRIDSIIQKIRIVDWISNSDVQNEMRNQIEDYLYELKKDRRIDLGPEEMDSILEGSINIARNKYA
ncbi:MAG: type I restriction endonuclease subunit R [Chloracidobacterium sp.]|nr:type I restriction endonuclease subunit R [Chloracidobacterium sp.]